MVQKTLRQSSALIVVEKNSNINLIEIFMDFISFLHDHRLISKYCKSIDRLLDDNRLSLLDQHQKSKLIKLIKKYDGFSKETFVCATNHSFLTQDTNKMKIYFLFTKSEGECESLLKHLRNAIAHKHVDIFKCKRTFYVKGFDCFRKKTTAYFSMPLDYLNNIYSDYLSLIFKEK